MIISILRILYYVNINSSEFAIFAEVLLTKTENIEKK